VLVALVMREPGWIEKSDWFEARASARCYSSFALGEFVDFTARQVRTGSLDPDAAKLTIEAVTHFVAPWERCETIDTDVTLATALIKADMRQSLKLADAILLATAKRVDAVLATADRRQAAAASAHDIAYHFFEPRSDI
jgi:predicted nucleic acid-binding protein